MDQDRRIPVRDGMHPRARARGFSLIELVIVLAILGVAAAIATPRYAAALERYRVEAGARRIAADLEAARAAARAESRSRTVAFTLAAGAASYTVLGQDDPDRPGAAYTVDLRAAPYRCRVRSADLGADGAVVFNGFGTPDAGGEVVVQCGRTTRRITIDAATGAVAVESAGDAAPLAAVE